MERLATNHERRNIQEDEDIKRGVKVTIYYSPHESSFDFMPLTGLIKDHDIYFYEAVCGEEKTQIFQTISNKNVDGDDFYLEEFISGLAIDDDEKGQIPLRGSIFETIFRSLYGTKTLIGHIDLRSDRNDEIELGERISEVCSREYSKKSFEQTLKNLEQLYKEDARLQHEREMIMVKRLGIELGDFYQKYPHLRRKGINALISIGSYHTSLYHELLKEGYDVTRVFSSRPYVYSYGIEAERAFAFGKTPDQELLARAHLENSIQCMTNRFSFSNSDQLMNYWRLVASRFSFEEIKSFHQINVRISSDVRALRMFNKVLKGKGILPLPWNDQDLADCLKQLGFSSC